MTRKPIVSPPADRILTPDELRQGIGRINRRIGDIESFEPISVKERWAPEVKALEASVEETLARVFGHGTRAYRRYQSAVSLDKGPIGIRTNPLSKVHCWLTEGKADSLALLRQAVKGLEEDLAEATDALGAVPGVADVSSKSLSDNVFVVHGHDDAAKEQVARVIERAGLNVTILHEQPNGGKTIIEKFENHGSAAGFAVVIATPDDEGAVRGEPSKPRARQNVIGEMFWFAGRLGRDRVFVLVKGEPEMPSDIAGIGYTPMDDHGGWKGKLLQELSEAGYKDLKWPAALS
ncbi:MAG: nucleotide-binding protein [Nitrobacter sp.]|uniref:nucleotide-binding protein n=1 Tax=Nitrobacter sp. TaxID=29420 RepID=UPI0026338876|nr:nucleotide-binding protein [Nitrobacter sp.]MCV0387566.1 nucleotide-binding protein [Nitrobacter sp.]